MRKPPLSTTQCDALDREDLNQGKTNPENRQVDRYLVKRFGVAVAVKEGGENPFS